MGELADDLQEIADSGFVVSIIDDSGAVIWTCADKQTHYDRSSVDFTPEELDRGASSLTFWPSAHRHQGSALPAEPFCEWTCYRAPLRDACGRPLGALCFSTPHQRANPLAASTVRVMASLIDLRVRDLRRRGESVAADDTVTFRCLDSPALTIAGSSVQISPRQAEILALLALCPRGFTPGELRLALYGDRQVSMSTLKAEVSRLRRLIGDGIAANRYVLTSHVRCDAADVLRHLSRGEIVEAVEKYRGPLLPQSEAPGIVDWRDRMQVAVREAALQCSDPHAAITLGERVDSDPELYEHALSMLPLQDSRTPLIAARLHVARRDIW